MSISWTALLVALFVSLLSAIALPRLSFRTSQLRSMATASASAVDWQAALDELPATPDKIPAFFFAHGSPALAFPKDTKSPFGGLAEYQGANGPLAQFLKQFGPTLLKKYQPKGIVVFSAHWETMDERLVTDYEENPLLMDYYGFPPDLYRLKFRSRGDSALAQRVISLYKEVGLKARTSPVTEPRGEDGRGFFGPGLDHGVFVPFRIMFGEEFLDIPIVQVSIDSSMDPGKNWEAGKAVTKLREEGILVLSGGLTAHNLRERESFSPKTARPIHQEFDRAIHAAIQISSAEERKHALFNLTKHPGFRASHPREDHFVPLYVALGAGDGGAVKTLMDNYGIPTFAFGL